MHTKTLRYLRYLVLTSLLATAIIEFAPPVWAITYEYDALGRVTKVTYDDGSYVEYEYDEAGNRTEVTGTKN